MNKKIILITFSLFLLGLEMNAQFFEKDSVFKNDHITFAGRQDFDVHMQVTNPSDFKDYTWTRKVIRKPADWTTAICDAFLCHDSTVSSGKFFLSKGESATFYTHFYFEDISGGYGSVQVILENDSTNEKDTAIFSINIWNQLKSVQTIDLMRFNIFPNPTNGEFTIQGKGIQSISIFNMQGQEIYTEDTEALDDEDLVKVVGKKDLPKGIYLVKVKQAGSTSEQKIVVTN